MTSRVHYEVRNDEGIAFSLSYGFNPRPATSDRLMSSRIRSRRAAETLASEHGGTVVRVTTTEEPVGLRWEYVYPGGTRLVDGRIWVGFVCDLDGAGCITEDGVNLARIVHPNEPRFEAKVYDLSGQCTYHDTVEAAKAACESAVKETWE